jgi:hypothetical protein
MPRGGWQHGLIDGGLIDGGFIDTPAVVECSGHLWKHRLSPMVLVLVAEPVIPVLVWPAARHTKHAGEMVESGG